MCLTSNINTLLHNNNKQKSSLSRYKLHIYNCAKIDCVFKFQKCKGIGMWWPLLEYIEFTEMLVLFLFSLAISWSITSTFQYIPAIFMRYFCLFHCWIKYKSDVFLCVVTFATLTCLNFFSQEFWIQRRLIHSYYTIHYKLPVVK